MKPTDTSAESSGDNTGSARPSVSKWSRLRRVRIAIVLMLLVCVAVIWQLGLVEEPLDRWLNPPDAPGLGFTVTAYPKLSLPSDPTFGQRFVYGYRNLRFAWEYHTRNPKRVLIYAQPPHKWDIGSLLQQCMWASGTRYLIAKGLQGEILFGTTNTLNGSQWAAAAEQALREDGMAVVHVGPKLVQVVPKSQLQDYRKAKLVVGGDDPPASSSQQ